MALHFMSDKELTRVESLRDLTAGRLIVSAASELLGLERRQVLRLPYRTFDKLRRVTETAVLENKRLGGLLAPIRQSQQYEPPSMRTSKGPKRRDQTTHMFSAG